MEARLQAMQDIQRSLKELQAQVSAMKYGFKLPGMKEPGEENLASGGMATRKLPEEGSVEEESMESPEEEAKEPQEYNPDQEQQESPEEENMESPEEEGKEQEMGWEQPINKGKKVPTKITAIRALIARPSKKMGK